MAAVTPGSGLIMIAPVSVCHQVSTTGHVVAADVLAVPDPRLGVDRLADRPEQPQRGQVVRLRGMSSPHFMNVRIVVGAVYRMVILYFSIISPPAVLVRRVRRALVHERRRPVGQRPVDDVAVPGDPADVGAAPVEVLVRLEVEDRPVGVRGLGQVAAGRVQDALRLAGRARRVHDVERVLGVERLRRVLGRLLVDDVVPPHVAVVVPLDVLLGALDDEHRCARPGTSAAPRPPPASAPTARRAGSRRRR